jgi:hypothetical protein
VAIQAAGGKARSFPGPQVRITTDSAYSKARILDIDAAKLNEAMDAGEIPVVAGFQGMDATGSITTLGRGGSDTTAVAMAAALDAEYCEICSDVDGVYSADPRVVGGAKRIGTLSYEETQEMAEAGAKVLNAQAVEFAKEKGIAIYARATSGTNAPGLPTNKGPIAVGVADIRKQREADERERARIRKEAEERRAKSPPREGGSVIDEFNAANPEFARVEMPFTVGDLFGGWQRAYPEIIDRVWRTQVKQK